MKTKPTSPRIELPQRAVDAIGRLAQTLESIAVAERLEQQLNPKAEKAST